MVFVAHVEGLDHQIELNVNNLDDFIHAAPDDVVVVYPKLDAETSSPLLVQKKYLRNLELDTSK